MRFLSPGAALLSIVVILPASVPGENWPCFRGPSRQGISTESGLPLKWSDVESIDWRTPIPGAAWSSPIVWGNRIFLTTATEGGQNCHLIAVERNSGRIVWDSAVFQQTAGHKQDRNSDATPTPCTDGQRVYALFGDGSFAALDFEGKTVWMNRDHPFYGEHGLGTSPILWERYLIVALDGSHPPPDTGSGWHTPWDGAHVVALNTETGRVEWKARRGSSRIAHVVPAIGTATDGRPILISGAGDVVQGFDPRNGERLWTSTNIGEGVVPSIVVGNGMAFTASGWGGRESIKAFRLEGKGNLGESNLAWEQRKAMPRIPSFLYLKPYLFTITEGGIAMCLKEDSGEIVWQERVGGNFSASPVGAEGHIYFLSDQGETTVIEAGPHFKVLARNPLNEKCQASIAISGRRIFLRSEHHLYCIGSRS